MQHWGCSNDVYPFFKFGVCSVFLPTEVICFRSQDLIERDKKRCVKLFKLTTEGVKLRLCFFAHSAFQPLPEPLGLVALLPEGSCQTWEGGRNPSIVFSVDAHGARAQPRAFVQCAWLPHWLSHHGCAAFRELLRPELPHDYFLPDRMSSVLLELLPQHLGRSMHY